MARAAQSVVVTRGPQLIAVNNGQQHGQDQGDGESVYVEFVECQIRK